MNKQDKATVVVAVATACSTIIISMLLNTWAFTRTLDTWFGATVGILLPCWILALTFMGHRLWMLNRHLAIGCYALAGFALLVSMPHLANGYALLDLSGWECWALAIVTDLTQVGCKMLVITLAHAGSKAKPAAKVATKGRQRTIKVA